MLTNKRSSRFAIAAVASLAASSALAGGVLPTPMSGVAVADLSAGQRVTASSQACAAVPAAPLVRNLRLGDLNGDGYDDLLLTRADGTPRHVGRTWQYYPMNGTAKIEEEAGEAALKSDLDWLVMGLGDFDGDGKTDVLTRDSTSGSWHLARMDGRVVETLGTGSADLTTNLDWRVAGIADFDNDGMDDVLLRHSITHRWWYYAMDERTHVASKSGPVDDLPDDASWAVAGVGDLDGDGSADVLLRHATNGTWEYFPMHGRDVVAAGSGAINLPTGSAWKLAGLADLNGDGLDDALLRNTSGTWHWYPLDGRTLLTGDAATDLSTSLDWKLAGLGDLNGDGKDDVVLRDVSASEGLKGRWMVRMMNGATSIVAQSGVATGITKITAWDVAARDNPGGPTCPPTVWACPSGTTAPGTPTINWMETNFSIIAVDQNATAYENLVTVNDFAQVPVGWAKSSGGNGDKARYVLNDEVVLEASLTGGGGTGSQSGSATLQVSRGGQYDLEVAVCKGTCCTRSAKKKIVVADTDGSHSDPITLTPPAGHTPYTNKTGSMLAAYYVEWSGYGRDFDVHDIPAWNLTHILYGFIPICSATENDSLKTIGGSHAALLRACAGRQDYKVAIHDPWAALGETRPGFTFSTPYKGNYGQLMQLKQAYPDLVILPSVGGWTLSDPFYAFNDPVRRKRFVDSVEAFLQVWKFYDGVDIDWEYPGGYGANRALGDVVTDRETYTLMMRDLRAMLDRMELRTGRKYHLTSAVGAGSEKIARVDYATVQRYMDHILLMTYDFYGAWDKVNLGHMPGPFAPSWDPTDDYNMHSAVQAMLAQGVDPAKVSVGASMYGRGWTGVNGWTGTDHLTGSATGAYPPTKDYDNFIWEPGTQDYRGIVIDEKAARDPNVTTTWTYHWDATAHAPYLYRSGTNDVISYDNADSVKVKGAYVRSKGLAGIFAWEIDGDNGDILNAMHEGLGHGTAGVNRAPTANAGPDRTVNSGAKAALDGSASFDLDGQPVTYSWTQTSGTTVTLTGTTTARPTFTAPTVTTSGTSLVFTLTVSDGTLTATDTVTITVRTRAANQAPTANAGADQTVQTRQTRTTVTLDGSASTDPDDDTLTYAWTQLTGDTVVLVNATTVHPHFETDEVTEDKTFTFQLQVSDGAASATDTVLITLQPPSETVDPQNQAPVVNLRATMAANEGAAVSITATATDPDGDALTYAWDTGTLTGATGTDTATVAFTAPQVTADADYTLTLTVTDDADTPASTTANIVLTVVDLDSTGCRTVDPNAANYPAWDSSRTYVQPNRVGHEGLVWEAKHWTQEEPVATETDWPQEWTLVSTTVEIAWNPERAYNTGDEANHGTRRYRAAYYTKGDNPTAGGPWTDVGATTCGANQAPTANAGADQDVAAGDSVTLDGSGSSDPDTGDTLTYNWAQTSGTPTVVLTNSSTASPTFTAPSTAAGSTLVFTLTVRDGKASATDTVTVRVAAAPNQAPTANAGPDQTVASGASVTLDGSGSSDPDGDTLSYSWSQTSGSPTVTLTGAATASPTFTAPSVSTSLVFTLTVSDGTTTRTDTVTIEVTPAGDANRAPTARAGTDQTVTSGALATLDGSGSSDPDGDTLSYSWSQTSGSPTVTLTGAATASPTFTAPSVSTSTSLVFSLTVSDGALTDTDTVTVTVGPANTAPTANAGADQSVTAGASVTLDGSASSDPDTGDTLTYSWAHTSGTPSVTLTGATTASPTFTAPSVSTSFVFTLTVSDGTASDTDTVTVTVTATGPCSRTDPNAGSYTAWSSTQSHYSGGDQVSHEGLAWQAKYWTQEEPAITATDWPGDWTLLSTTELKWHPERVYVKDDEADHGTRRYRAAWWTQGANPATDTTGVWTDIGAATCPVDHY